MPLRETFALLPAETPRLMFLVFLPFAIVFAYGVWRRTRGLGLARLLAQAPGGPLGALRRLALDGLLQGRVRQRPSGWPHLAIFGGFAVLTLGTTLVALDWDLARPLGFRLLAGPFYLGFEAVLDVAGLLLLVGAAVALARRLLRPTLQARRIKLQYIALLVGLLYLAASGFLLEAQRLALLPSPWRAYSFVGDGLATLLGPLASTQGAWSLHVVLWWSHAVAAFTLLALAPFSVSFHALSAPLNMLASSGRPEPEAPMPFDLRELMQTGNYDVKAGASSLQDLPGAFRLSLEACTDCGRCDEACPAHQAGSALSPVRLMRSLGRVEAAEDLFSSGCVAGPEVWACTTCAACIQVCPVLAGPLPAILPLRRELVTRQGLDRRQKTLLDNLGRAGNPYGASPGERSALTRELGLLTPSEAPDAEYLYWIGCAGVFDARIRSVVKSTVRVLRAAGVSLSALGADERCTGDAARRLGEEGLFQQLALQNIEVLQQHRIRRIVTHCAHCFSTLKNEYPQLGGRFEVLHHSELIAQLMSQQRLPPLTPSSRHATLHDSCYMGRYNQVFDAPRQALDGLPGLEFVEMPRCREQSFCCGGGGGTYWYEVPAAVKASTLRFREAEQIGASTLVTACPFCLKMLEAAGAAQAGGLHVKDIAELVAEALEPSTLGVNASWGS